MSSTTPLLSLPLRVWPEGDPNGNSLSTLIQRINEQKGQFRNVTEQSLEEEIQASTLEGDAVEKGRGHENDESSRDREDEVGRKETLLAAREDILKQVGIAYMEAYYALDFVSLLLSKDTPRQAELSMSQHLKQHVPLGSLGAEKVQAQQESAEVLKDQELVCKGWKLQSLNTAADALIKSATRLELEIEQETRYWEDILAIDQRHWSLCRLPRERHTLGVRFGFLEAATEFRERGLAALRRGDNGKVILDQGLNNSKPKVIRVRIQNRDRSITGSSSVPSIASSDATSVEELILQCRDSIYEEELYHELLREARILTNQSIQIHDATVVLVLPGQQQILIDLIPLNSGEVSSSQDTNTTTTNNTLAESIVLALRILLSHAHCQNHHRRSQLPPPLTDRKRPVPPYSILRPVLTHLLHQHSIRSLRRQLKSLLLPLRQANLPAQITLEAGTNCSLPNNQITTESTILTFNGGIESLFRLSLPNQTTLTLQTRTLLYPPVLGTEYIITTSMDPANLDSTTTTNSKMHFTTPEETRRYITYIATLSLVSEIMSYNNPQAAAAEGHNANSSSGDHGTWMRGSAFNELVIAAEKGRIDSRLRKRLAVLVDFSDDEAAAKVGVRWCRLDGKMPTSSSPAAPLDGRGMYVWTAKGGGPEEQQGMGVGLGLDMATALNGRTARSFREVIDYVAESCTLLARGGCAQQ